ncbi:MAG: T9SS type A sorting domain-containing protein [Bacteroidetes bacterium]|nr:T9SS type A sorting domain-containing protein [Bacteroidota bacterium]
MKLIQKLGMTAVVLLLAVFINRGVSQTTSITSGSYNDGATWSTSAPPQQNQHVVIASGTTVTVTMSNTAQLYSITIESGGTLVIGSGGYIVVGSSGWGKKVDVTGTLTLENGGAITVGGAYIYVDGTVNMHSTNGAIDAVASPLYLYSGSSLNYSAGEIWTGNLYLNSGATLNATGSDGIFVDGNANIAGAITTTGTFPGTSFMSVSGSTTVSGSLAVGATTLSGNYSLSTPMSLTSGSEVRYLAAGNQTIDVSYSYYNLTLEGSGNKSISSNLTVNDHFKIAGSAAFVNASRNVNCGSSLQNNSTATHTFGTGTYTFTGTTIGGSGTTTFSDATVNFTGSSIIIGDGAAGWGDGNISFKNVSFSNASADLSIGANGYTGTVSASGLLSMSGDNASMLVSGGTLGLNNITVSGGNSTVSFAGGASTHTVSGNTNCGNNLSIGSPVSFTGNVTTGNDMTVGATSTVGGAVTVNGDLLVSNHFDVGGTVDVMQNFTVTGSGGTSTNDFSGKVTVSGTSLGISGGNNHFTNGLSHDNTASGSSCSIAGTFTTGTGTTATTLHGETVQLAGTLTFNRLLISNANGAASASTGFTVNHTLSLAKDLDMTGYTLTFPAAAPQTAVTGGGEVLGNVRRTLQNTGTYTFNGQYITLLIPNLASAEEYEFKFTRVAPDLQAVTRCYDIRRVGSDLTPSSWQYTLGLYYKDSELNGNQESTLMLAYGDYDIAGEDQFTKLSSSGVNTTSNIVTFVFDGITSFNHRYTIADMNAPLPVELVSFGARRKDRSVQLRWKTATELNNFGFEIERADERDGSYASIGFIEGFGTKNSPSDYQFEDSDVPAHTVYYRLRQMDRDGAISYSPVVEVMAGGADPVLRNYPNPFNPSTVITFQAPQDGRAVLTVFNTLGKQVGTAFDADVRREESVSIPFDAGHLPGGVYFYTLSMDGVTRTGKMLLNK